MRAEQTILDEPDLPSTLRTARLGVPRRRRTAGNRHGARGAIGEAAMDLILWRHAEAEKEGSDQTRALTARGRWQAAAAAAWLKPRLPATVRVLASPALRARQTAEALGSQFATVPELACPAPGASPAAILKVAGWPEGRDAVVVVGHQPVLGQTAALILCGRQEPWQIPTGALWWFTGASAAGEGPLLRAVVTPADLL